MYHSADITSEDKLETFGIDECAAFLKIARTHALTLAADGILPGAKVGREWVFLKEDLILYLKEEVRNQTRERKAKKTKTLPDTVVTPMTVMKKPGRQLRPLPDLSQY